MRVFYMDGDSWLSYFILFLLLIFSAYFACAETAFSSASAVRIKTKADDGDKRAKKAHYILNNFDNAISTLLCGNNVCHIALAAYTTVLTKNLLGESYIAAATVLTTVVVFLFAETIPKNLAAAKCDELALFFAPSLRFLMTVLYPFVFVFSAIAKLAVRIFGASSDPTVTEEELHGIIDTITEDGTFEDEKGKLLQSAMDFDDRTAQDVFTARVDLDALDVETPAEEIVSFIKETRNSRIPV